MGKLNIEQTLARYLASGKIDQTRHDNLLGYIKSFDKNNLAVGIAKLWEIRHGQDELYHSFVEKAKSDGCWYPHEENLKKASENLDKILEEASESGEKNYFDLAENLDNSEYADLYAAFVLNIPEVRQKVRQEIGTYDNLYRVTRSILRGKRKKVEKKYRPDIQESNSNSKEEISSTQIYLDILKSLPDNHFQDLKKPEENLTPQQKEIYEDKRRLFLILKEKAKRDCFKLFKENQPYEAIQELEHFVQQQTNTNIHFLYEDQLEIFQEYLSFQEKLKELDYINSEFEHPASGQKGVLPSFHQTVAIYHNLEEKRFGVFDDCGTGKTAIAALLKQPIIEKKKQAGKKIYGRTLVIGPKSSSKAWKDGLEGELEKRYFSEKQKVAQVNGTKDAAFLEELKNADFTFINYEQLLCDFTIGGKKRKVYEILIELGYDNLIIDEVQEAKSDQNTTKKGRITESFAVRVLANNPQLEYLTLLSGTPMPDNLNDYANILFMLKPEYFVKEKEVDGKKVQTLDFNDIKKRFYEIYEGDPRALYTLIRQNTIRRTSEEVSDLPGHELIEEEIELTPVQNKIIDYVFEKGKKDWLTQIRYAILDPRLVSPVILQEMGLVGQLTRTDSAKYVRLEEILAAENGPIANNEKVIIFSSMFAAGVTREAEKLKQEYTRLGLAEEFEKLNINNLKDDLESHLGEKFNRSIEIMSIDAFTADSERELAVDRLNNGLDGIVCTTKSGGVSLNFSAASTCIFLDQHYSPATTDQGIARIARRGQRKKAKIYFLYGVGSIDYDVKKLIENKRENIQMALDGVELLNKEKEILWGVNDKRRLKELFLQRRGGMAVDLSQYTIEDIYQFETKRVIKKRKKSSNQVINLIDVYEQTAAQEIRKTIANDPINCWHNPDFVKKYFDNFNTLSPYLLARAKVMDLIKRSSQEEIEFPKLLLADAAGHGILYSAFQDLDGLIEENNLTMPLIVDRDFSEPMHQLSPNPHKYLANMCGQPGIFEEEFFEEFGKFDFIDNSSITLLPNQGRIRDYILETNRILELGGHLQLGVGGWYFAKEFFQGMEKTGFKPIVKSVKHGASKQLFKFLKSQFGQHYAEAYVRKLEQSNFSLFKKTDEVDKVDKKYFLLENPEFDKEESEAEKEECKGTEETKPKKKTSKRKKSNGKAPTLLGIDNSNESQLRQEEIVGDMLVVGGSIKRGQNE